MKPDFNVELFNQNNDTQFSILYVAIYEDMMRYCEKKITDKKEVKRIVDKVFAFLRKLENKNFKDEGDIEKFLRESIDVCCTGEKER